MLKEKDQHAVDLINVKVNFDIFFFKEEEVMELSCVSPDTF